MAIPLCDEEETNICGEIKGNYCKIEERINKLFIMIKQGYKEIREKESKICNRFYEIKWICEKNIDRLLEIETLALVLHPEYDYSAIDHYSLNKFLDGYLINIKIKYYTRGKLISFREFNPVKKCVL